MSGHVPIHLVASDRAEPDRLFAARQHISGAIVTYHPESVVLSKVIAAVSLQVDRLLIITNGGGECPHALPENAVLAKQGKTLGPAQHVT